jgi:hypothetical protein
VYLREGPIRDAVNGWIGELFAPENLDTTVRALVDSQEGLRPTASGSDARTRLADAEAKLRRFQAAIEAGIDPAALVEVTNQAQAVRANARAELEHVPATGGRTDAEIYAMIDSLGEVGAALASAKPDRLASLYAAVDLQVRYEPSEQVAEVTIEPDRRVNSACVRGGT